MKYRLRRYESGTMCRMALAYRHELTAFGLCYTLLPVLLFLGALAWFLHLTLRKRRSACFTLRKN